VAVPSAAVVAKATAASVPSHASVVREAHAPAIDLTVSLPMALPKSGTTSPVDAPAVVVPRDYPFRHSPYAPQVRGAADSAATTPSFVSNRHE